MHKNIEGAKTRRFPQGVVWHFSSQRPFAIWIGFLQPVLYTHNWYWTILYSVWQQKSNKNLPMVFVLSLLVRASVCLFVVVDVFSSCWCLFCRFVDLLSSMLLFVFSLFWFGLLLFVWSFNRQFCLLFVSCVFPLSYSLNITVSWFWLIR